MTVGLEQLRLAAALAHAMPDGDVLWWVATFALPPVVEVVLADLADEGNGLSAHVIGDLDLGTNVVSISGGHPVLDLRATAMAHRVAAACMVEELLGAGDRQATG